ncbi:MAG: peptidylprolyl isomerase [Parcubacteria group bacterium]
MKKTLGVCLVVGLVIIFSACSQKEEANKTPNPVTDPGGYDKSMLNTKDKAAQDVSAATDQENGRLNDTLNNNDNAMNASENGSGDNSELVKKYNTAIMKTSLGDIELKLDASNAPVTVGNFLKLASSGFYDGTKFHRVIKDFMIQGGDPLSKDDSQKASWGTGDPGYKFNDELTGKETYTQGTLAMANSGPNTNGSQFFIVTASPSYPLPPSYTVFGHVTSGLDVALKIQDVQTDPSNNQPLENVTINSIQVLEK